LKIPEGLSEVVNQRTDNSMAKRKRTKGQTMIWKTLHRKLKTINNQGYYRRVSGSCFTIGTRHVTLVTNLVISHEWEKDRVFLMTREALVNWWIFGLHSPDVWSLLIACIMCRAKYNRHWTESESSVDYRYEI
jgi:hypothetical protein